MNKEAFLYKYKAVINDKKIKYCYYNNDYKFIVHNDTIFSYYYKGEYKGLHLLESFHQNSEVSSFIIFFFSDEIQNIININKSSIITKFWRQQS
jgi:hypothetical protein